KLLLAAGADLSRRALTGATSFPSFRHPVGAASAADGMGRGSTMSLGSASVRFGARLCAVAALTLLCGCIGNRDLPTAEPSFYRSLATKGAEVDATMAASMIS